MPRPARPWFRLYASIADNPKFHDLPDRLVRPWIILLSLASDNDPRGHLPSLRNIAFKLRVKEDKAQGIIAALVERRLLDVVGQHYIMHDWDVWQYESDARDTAQRNPTRGGSGAHVPHNGGGSGAHVPPRADTEKETDTEAEKDTEQKQSVRAPEAFPEDDDSSFTSLYRRNHEQATHVPINGYRMADAIDLRKKYGDERCIEAAALLGWDKAPKYYIPRLEEQTNGRNGQSEHQPAASSPFKGIGK